MALTLKFDENLPHDAAQLLREAGQDVSTVSDEGLGGASDQSVAEAARREGRVLVTLDSGSADIRAYPPRTYLGFIVLRLRRQDKPRIREALTRVVEALAFEGVAGRLWIVEERRIRIRS